MIKSIDPNDLEQPVLYHLLSTAVAPRPICFASTIDKNGNVNLSPFSFFNVFSSNPPVMVFSPNRSGRDNSLKHTHQNINEVPEVVISIVNHAMAEQMSLSSTAYAKGVNEFVKAGFTEVQSDTIKPPRVGEAPVSFECTVREIIELAHTPGAGNLIIVEVQRIHINEAYLTDNKLDTLKLDLIGRMGGSHYIKANGDALFEIPKPIRTKGIGIDQLPQGIRESKVLTGNNLGRLGNLESLPSEELIKSTAATDTVVEILNNKESDKMDQLHRLAKDMLEQGDTLKAICTLMIGEEL